MLPHAVTAPHPEPDQPLPTARTMRIALLGNPNTGKTTLFNRLTGLRHKTSNFPGTTQESRTAIIDLPDGSAAQLIDLPGVYSLEIDQPEAAVCRDVIAGNTAPRGEIKAEPDALLVILDATNLGRNLVFLAETARRRLPTIIAINMIDLARNRGLHIDLEILTERTGCPVVPICARTAEGLDKLTATLPQARIPSTTPAGSPAAAEQWADEITRAVSLAPPAIARERFTERLDHAFTHPILGVFAFALVMAGLFWVVFKFATIPMDLIDLVFARLANAAATALPEGILSSLIADGLITGVGATLIFLPQILLLFFLLSLLEDTGYLARATFVIDRMLKPVGLPGHAFVPLLTAHACALPAIMAARAVPDRKQRLATILVAPFMTCSARLPVYALLVTVLFRDRPLLAPLAFVGCYALGIAAALASAFFFRHTLLRSPSRLFMLELPSYKLPSLRTALMTTWDRGLVFLKNAGTVILAITIILWWLESYPISTPPPQAESLRAQAAQIEPANPEQATQIFADADRIESAHAKANSFAGKLGHFIQPVFEPLGFDWRLSIGVFTSLAAREVFVSTMAVVIAGDDDTDSDSVLNDIASAKRDDGSPLFDRPTAWSLLTFFVLAMLCLPTLAVTAKESGSWKWAALQFAWMTAVAYSGAFLAYTLASLTIGA